MKIFICLFLIVLYYPGFTQTDTMPYQSNRTFEHSELIKKYARLQRNYPSVCTLVQQGSTDALLPLHLFIINKNGQFSPEDLSGRKTAVVFILNGIHPGEPCGIDASYKLAAEYVSGKKDIPGNITICIVPIYNVDGALNRGCCSRANQNGPLEYGFRGNGQNLDLNRDFIKLDSRNARTLVGMLRFWNPDLFIDTHTSNGADYQYVMTLITSQKDKAAPVTGRFMTDTLEPILYKKMEEAGFPMSPYVNTAGATPETGIYDYLETPRYSTGYANLFGAMSFVTEAHMLKPFEQRVHATYHLLNIFISTTSTHAGAIIKSHRKQLNHYAKKHQKVFLNYAVDTTIYQYFQFKGFAAEYPLSEVTGLPQLQYNQQKPIEINIRWYRKYIPADTIVLPDYYLIPGAWYKAIELLDINKIQYSTISADTTIKAEVYFIENYNTVKKPYEGHYLHYDIELKKKTQWTKVRPGDILIPVKGDAARFLAEVLEPNSEDSWFAWNYFDATLMQKEWYSTYVFDEYAAEMLKNDPEMKKRFDQKKANEESFRISADAQFYWLYQQSPLYEPGVNRYPVIRIVH